MSQTFHHKSTSRAASAGEDSVSLIHTTILFWLQTFVFQIRPEKIGISQDDFFGTNYRSLLNIVVSLQIPGGVLCAAPGLPCTAYHWGSFPTLYAGKRKRIKRQSCISKSLCSIYLLVLFSFPLAAQDSIATVRQDTSMGIRFNVHRNISPYGTSSNVGPSINNPPGAGGNVDSLNNSPLGAGGNMHPANNSPLASGARSLLTPRQVKSRVRFVAISNVAGYSAILAGLNSAWYSNYDRSRFHTFNDNKEWLQIDKVGHMYGAYIESRTSMELWRWTGIDRKKRIWYGGLSGIVYQTIIETLDGFSTGWGWSWGDIGANILGSGTLIAQELAWDDQRIKLKFSFHKNNYGDPRLNNRADKIFGKTLAERFIKDYNAQTYWASANLKSFLPKTNLPPWLCIAVGYGAEGMFGANDNTGKDPDGNINFDRRDIKRYRQWYLSPDIDFTKIKTRKKGVRFLFTVLSAFKFPAPSLEFSNGKFKVNALHF